MADGDPAGQRPGAHGHTDGASGAGGHGRGDGAREPGAFDHDTAVERLEGAPAEERRRFGAVIQPGWRAGRGPHGGYLAAIILRALTDAVDEPGRTPRSLTIHYARAPQEGPVEIDCRIERQGRSLSTLSARMYQGDRLAAIALAAFSVPWPAPEISELQMPDVAPPEPERVAGAQLRYGAPEFNRHVVLQPRIGGLPFGDGHAPMDVGGWLGLDPPRALDAISLAFFCDALVPPVMIRVGRMAVPTVDLTIHFRTSLPPSAGPGDGELCFAAFRSRVVHEGFFEEDGVIWAADGTVLAQSRQLGVVIAPHDERGEPPGPP